MLGPRRSVDHADLHARARGAPAGHVRPLPPAPVTRRAPGASSRSRGVAVALVALVCASLPPRGRAPRAAARRPPVVRGAIHVHTRRSDGAGTPDEVAARPRTRRPHFVVLTDHGDATRAPDPPRVRRRRAVSSTPSRSARPAATTSRSGCRRRRIASPASRATWSRTSAASADSAIAAHPDSPKPELRWTDWDAGFDGLEWLNADSEWRDEPALSLLRGFASYWVPRARDDRTAPRPRRARVRRMGSPRPRAPRGRRRGTRRARANRAQRQLGTREHRRRRAGARIRERVRCVCGPRAAPASAHGPRQQDADLVLEAVRRGRVFTVIDAFAGPADLQFTVQGDAGTLAQMGDTFDGSGPARLLAAVTPVPGVRLRAPARWPHRRPGRRACAAYEHPGGLERAVYRVEAFLQGRGTGCHGSWAIRFTAARPPITSSRVPLDVAAQEPLSMEPRPGDWLVERAPQCEGRLARAEDGARVRVAPVGRSSARTVRRRRPPAAARARPAVEPGRVHGVGGCADATLGPGTDALRRSLDPFGLPRSRPPRP